MRYLSQRGGERLLRLCIASVRFPRPVKFMISGPIDGAGVEGEEPLARNRELMARPTEEGEKGTIRADFAESIDANAVQRFDGRKPPAPRSHTFSTASEIFFR